MRKCCINSNQKIQHKKSIKNYFSWQESKLLATINCIWATLLLSTMGQKNGKERSSFGSDFVHFQLENWPHEKCKNQQSNIPAGPPKGLKLQETKENHLSTCDKW